jgi:hypothetical protein
LFREISFGSLFFITLTFFYLGVAIFIELFMLFQGDGPLAYRPSSLTLFSLFYFCTKTTYDLLLATFGSPFGHPNETEPYPRALIAASWKLLLVWIVALLIRAYNNIYFHQGVSLDYNLDAGNVENLVDKLHLIGLSGLGLLAIHVSAWNKYPALKWHFIAILIISVAIYVPSGSRMMAIGHLPLVMYILIILSEKKWRATLFLMLTIFALIGILGNLRVDIGDQTKDLEQFSELVISRLADFDVSGQIFDLVPSQFPPRGLEGLEQTYAIALPNIYRETFGVAFNFNESTEYTLRLGISPGYWMSVPVTLIGDLYGRFLLPGVIIGGVLVGLILAVSDVVLRSASGAARVILFFLFGRYVFGMYSGSLLATIIYFARDLWVCLLIAFLVDKFIGRLHHKRHTTRRTAATQVAEF